MSTRIEEVLAYFERQRKCEERRLDLERWHLQLASHFDDLRQLYVSHGLDELIGMEP